MSAASVAPDLTSGSAILLMLPAVRKGDPLGRGRTSRLRLVWWRLRARPLGGRWRCGKSFFLSFLAISTLLNWALPECLLPLLPFSSFSLAPRVLRRFLSSVLSPSSNPLVAFLVGLGLLLHPNLQHPLR